MAPAMKRKQRLFVGWVLVLADFKKISIPFSLKLTFGLFFSDFVNKSFRYLK